MSIVNDHPRRLVESSPLELELACILHEAALMKSQEKIQEFRMNKRPAPLYLEQARILSRHSLLRQRIRIILDSNEFPQGDN